MKPCLWAAHVERRWGAKHLLIIGAAVLALGYAAMPALIMQAVPVAESGALNGLNALMRSLGTTIASAVTGAILAHSITTVGGVTGPSEPGFLLALALGLGAAILSVIIAAFIPRPGAH